MNTLTCFIIDDEPLAQALMESYVEKTPFLQLCGTFSNAIEALGALKENPVNLVFLDIQMPELSGLELAKLIPSTTRIIFTTAFNQYALEGYRVHALDYLLKPIAYPDFLETAQHALETFQSAAIETPTGGTTGGQQSLFVKSDYKLLRINYDEILYVEGLKDYVKIYLTTTPRPILSLTSMKSIESHLPANLFLRIHRSFVVNMERITAIERGNVLIGEKSLPISDSYRDKVSEYVNQRLIVGR